jgi:hypothetical protein
MNGDSWRATAVKGLAGAAGCSAAGSWTTANGESGRLAGWLGKLSNIPRFVLILKIG